MLLWLLIGYLCGSIPFGLLVGFAKGLDIRKAGSGNIGATNVGRVLGSKWGILVFGLDVFKGLIPVITFGWFFGLTTGGSPMWSSVGGGQIGWLLMAITCILGHVFPVFIGFKGGKGVATSLGAMLGVYPYFTLPALAALAIWIAVTWGSRYVSLGSVTAAIVFPIFFAIFSVVNADRWGGLGEQWLLLVVASVMAGLVVFRHRGNLQRLWRGTESKIGSSENNQSHAESGQPS